MRTPYDWSDDLKKLTMPVMLVFGDSDMFRLERQDRRPAMKGRAGP